MNYSIPGAVNRSARICGAGDSKFLVPLDWMRRSMFISALLCALIQLFIDPGWGNMRCVLIAFFSSLVFLSIVLNGKNARLFPVSTFVIWACVVVYLWSPLVLTTLGWRAVIFQLQLPLKTFAWSALAVGALVLAQYVCRVFGFLGGGRRFVFSKIYMPLGLFRCPSGLQLWGMGLLGLGAVYYVYVWNQSALVAGQFAGPLNKLIQAFTPFVVAPFVSILLSSLTGRKLDSPLLTVVALICHFGLILVAAVFSNVRGFFAVPLISVVLMLILLVITNRIRIGAMMRVALFFSLPVGFFVLSFLGDLATAMRIARSDRGQISSFELAKTSIGLLADRDRLDEYNRDLALGSQLDDWDETYVSSPLLSRFVVTKFVDNGLGLIEHYDTPQNNELRSYTWDRLIALLPSPILNRLGFSVDKNSILSMSVGDYMFYLVHNNGLGSFRTGSFIANGLAVLGVGFLPVLVLIAIVAFVFFDALASPAFQQGEGMPSMRARIGLLLSPFVLIFAYDFFIYFACESVVDFVAIFIRGFMQKVAIYAILIRLIPS